MGHKHLNISKYELSTGYTTGMFNTVTTWWHHGSSSQWQSLAGLSAQQCGWLVLLPKGSYWVASQMRSVTSSIVGPWDGVSCSGPLRATLPMEVVTVSIYVTPVASSLMMRLMLMVTILGAVTTPMANGLGDTSGALSGDSSLFKHAITPRELEVSDTGQMTSSSCTG